MSDGTKDPKPLRKVTYPFPKADRSIPSQPKKVETKDAGEYFDALSKAQDGFYPIGYNGQWHGGIHFGAETGTSLYQNDGIRCIADGEVIAYRIDDDYPVVEYKTCAAATYSRGFVLVRHRLQLPPAPKTQADTPTDANATSTNASASQTQDEPSLVFYSLYMHLRNWKAYEADPRLKRPDFWDGKEYLVGKKAKDKEEALAPGQTGLRVRDGGHKPIAVLPRGTRLTLGAAVPIRPNGFHELAAILSGDTVPAGQHTGRVYSPELDLLPTPSAKGKVVVLPAPVEIKAGDLIGHIGQYQRYSDMNPLATSCTERPLAQLDVFTADDLQAFITQSRTRDSQLDEKQKTLLHIKPGAQLVQPVKADIELPTGDAAIITAGDTGDRWVRGRRGSIQTYNRSILSGFTTATRTYGNGSIFLAAVRPSDGGELGLEQYNALTAAEQKAYSQRKVLVPTAGEIWLDRAAADAFNVIQGPANAWSEFPLKTANAAGDAVMHSRVIAIKSVEASTKEADGTRWFLTDAGGGATGTLHGWVREKDHTNVSLCSPWAWPGFILMYTGTLQPKDLYGRSLTQTRQSQASERSKMESLKQSAEKSPLFDALCKAIDADEKDGITPLELRNALRKPWLAQSLSRLAIKHHSEWVGPMGRWDEIDELIPEPRKEDWEREKGRIKKLQFWDDLKGKSGFPDEPKVHHLHPVGIIDNLLSLPRHPVILVLGVKTELEFLDFYDGSIIEDVDYTNAASDLGCEMEAIKAVAMSETGTTGSYYSLSGADTVPAILYERHYFHKLTGGTHSAANADISNSSRGGYGRFSEQYPKLLKAYNLDRSAALQSASWGKFQIMGSNYSSAGYSSVDEFVRDISISEKNHLKAFVNFIKADSRLSKAILEKDWLSFALAYNGPAQNGYDTKMRDNYNALTSKK